MKKKIHVLLILICCVSALRGAANPRLYFSPFSPVLGNGLVGIDYPITADSSLGPALTFYDFRDGARYLEGYGLGVQWEIFVGNDVYTDSWVLTPKISAVGAGRSGKTGWAVSTALLFGYAWYWPSGFKLRFGLEGEYISLKFDRFSFEQSNFSKTGVFSLGYYY